MKKLREMKKQYRVRKTQNSLGDEVYAVYRKYWFFWLVQKNTFGETHGYRDKNDAYCMMNLLASREEAAVRENKRNSITQGSAMYKPKIEVHGVVMEYLVKVQATQQEFNAIKKGIVSTGKQMFGASIRERRNYETGELEEILVKNRGLGAQLVLDICERLSIAAGDIPTGYYLTLRKAGSL